ncbi:galanin receptor 2a-like [Saccostrea echinata]|uniref:galanin receptor 2a-like n=1 Tax=Saccostrea echinata TaxID=191078 RepID=UPI002A803675|nr:galanin receptor 2a-like [Saccostrea echinata]
MNHSMDLTNGTNISSTTYTEELAFIIPLTWGLLVLVGSIGNGLVIFTLGKNGELTPTNVYVINLALADLTFLIIVVPTTTVGFAVEEWVFGDAVCKICNYMIYVTLHATCFTLTALTIDRYHAIVNAVSSMNWRSRRTSTIVSMMVWAVSFLISIPFAMYHKEQKDVLHNKLYCVPDWGDEEKDKLVSLIVIFTTYVNPLGIIIVCYTQILRNLWSRKRHTYMPSIKTEDDLNSSIPLSRRSQTRRRGKVTRMVFIVVLLFAVCWLPVHVFQLIRIFNPHFPKTTPVYVLKMISHTLSYANSIVNPFVYAFLNDGFRKAFRRTFPFVSTYCPCAQLHVEGNSNASDMVDRCIQTRVGECQDENGNGGTEIVSMSHVSEYKNSIPMVILPRTIPSDIEERSGSEQESK